MAGFEDCKALEVENNSQYREWNYKKSNHSTQMDEALYMKKPLRILGSNFTFKSKEVLHDYRLVLVFCLLTGKYQQESAKAFRQCPSGDGLDIVSLLEIKQGQILTDDRPFLDNYSSRTSLYYCTPNLACRR